MKARFLIAAAMAAPAILMSTAGSAAAVDAANSQSYEDGKCTVSQYSNGHGYIFCSRTYALTGFSSSSESEIDAINKAKAKNNERAAGFTSSGPSDFAKKHSGETPPPGAQGSCNSRLAQSSFDSWYFPTEQGLSDWYSWNPQDDASTPYGGVQRQTWNVSCTVSW
ncbi:hypothetical protein ABZV60_16755 [Streptomyces sp. NPDC004787]|uniref:hypothetical protein n=1 Tax=Streptomyces sp. NPDC004787 TaxID=3154291 RepID=UPI0033A1FD15